MEVIFLKAFKLRIKMDKIKYKMGEKGKLP
jgi:hypothetical protein